MEVGIASPLIMFTAFSTAVLPISAGCWAIVPSIRPSRIAARASSVASKPITMMSLPAPEIASTAPRAISSFAANTAWISPLAWSMFSITLIPSVRSKFAVCFATTSSFASATLWKPAERSIAADAPGVPSSSATLMPSPSVSTIY